MEKYRTTTHQGKGEGNAKHNDRISKKNMTAIIIDCDDGDDFEISELKFYEERYGKQLEEQNAKYKAKRNYDRVKTMKEFYSCRRYAPVEQILQYGGVNVPDDAKPDTETFAKMMDAYLNKIWDWDDEHGNHLHILNCAIHNDEASIHAHNRWIWDYKDEHNVIRCGQEEAMKQAGIELPDPDQPEGRYNNRNMTFTKMIRGYWNDVCEEFGYPVERASDKTRVRKHEAVKTFKRRTALELQQAEDEFENYKQQELENIELKEAEAQKKVDEIVKSAEDRADEINSKLADKITIYNEQVRLKKAEYEKYENGILGYKKRGQKVVTDVENKADAINRGVGGAPDRGLRR